jgi:drug/metabolite transporter (DMT)-like permease
MIRIYFLITLCVLFWSGNFIIGRYVHEEIEPMQLAFFRWLGAAILMLPIFIKSYNKIFQTIKSNFIMINFLALLGITLFNTLLYVGLQSTTATNALLINSFVPILILIFSYFILKISINQRQLIGILLSTFGVIFLVLKGDFSNLLHVKFNSGDFWVISSSVTWAAYSVFVKFKPKNLSDFEFFTTIVYIGLFWLFLAYTFFGYSIKEDLHLVIKFYPAFLYVSLFTSVLSYYFWHQGIHHIGANKTGQFTHLMPFFGAILAYIFLGERLYMYHIIGAFLIGSGIYLSLFVKKEIQNAK